jgi:hypothetical protein
MGLLDGQARAFFAQAFGGIFLDATLYRATLSDDGAGGGTASFAAESVKAQLDETTQAMRAAEGYTDTDQRILVLAEGVDPITTDDEITVGGIRWAIASVSQDPCGAYFELRGRRSGQGMGS